MRLEVFCEDRLGLTRELLDLLVLRGIDLRGIDIDPIGRIYLNFAELEFATFSSLMAEIRRIAGVTDVRTVPWMPSEREHLALSALLGGDAGAGAVAGYQRQGGTGQPRQLPAVWPKPGEAAQPSGGPADRRF